MTSSERPLLCWLVVFVYCLLQVLCCTTNLVNNSWWVSGACLHLQIPYKTFYSGLKKVIVVLVGFFFIFKGMQLALSRGSIVFTLIMTDCQEIPQAPFSKLWR